MPKRELDVRPIYYVYVLFDWLGMPRYVGKGKNNRITRHEIVSDPTNWIKNEFIEQTWIMLGDVPKIFVHENINEATAIKYEILFIAAIGRLDQEHGPLTNKTDGGDGISGYVHTNKARSLMSEKSYAYQQSLTPEQRSERARLREASMPAGARSAASKRGADGMSAESKSERGRKAVATIPKEELIRRLNGQFTFEQRSDRLKMAFAKLSPERRSDRSRAGGIATAKLFTSEEQSRRVQKGLIKMIESKSNTRWINNGVKNKLLKKDIPIPEGWIRGRLPFVRNIDHQAASEAVKRAWITRRNKQNKSG